jgi:hypothetical protein
MFLAGWEISSYWFDDHSFNHVKFIAGHSKLRLVAFRRPLKRGSEQKKTPCPLHPETSPPPIGSRYSVRFPKAHNPRWGAVQPKGQPEATIRCRLVEKHTRGDSGLDYSRSFTVTSFTMTRNYKGYVAGKVWMRGRSAEFLCTRVGNCLYKTISSRVRSLGGTIPLHSCMVNRFENWSPGKPFKTYLPCPNVSCYFHIIRTLFGAYCIHIRKWKRLKVALTISSGVNAYL